MTQRIPKKGELLIVDGITRRITEVRRSAVPTGNDDEFSILPSQVTFTHPDAEAEQARRKLMTAWKGRRDAWVAEQTAAFAKGKAAPADSPLAVVFAATKAGEAPDVDQLDVAFRMMVELPPERSRDGACSALDLDWMDGLNCWALRGRIEAKRPNSGANVVLQPAVAKMVAAATSTEG